MSGYKQVLLLYITTLVSVVVGVGTSVLNTSFLTPSEYGDVRYINNIINFIASLLLFGYFIAGSKCLATCSNFNHSRNIKGAMVLILLIASLIAMISMLVCYYIHFYWINNTIAYLFVIAIPIAAAPLFQNYVNTVFQGDNSIGLLSLARLLPSLLYLVIAYCVYNYITVCTELVILLQNGIILIVLGYLIYLSKPTFGNIKATFAELYTENRRYGFDVYVGSVIAVSLGYIGGVTLGIFENDNTNVGYFTLALTLSTPLSMLPAIVGTTFFKKFANQNYIDPKTIKITILISALSFLVFILLIVPIVDVLYSDAYKDVAYYSIILAIGTTMHGFGDFFNRFLGSHGMGKELRNGAVLSGLVLVIGYILFVYIWGIMGAVLTRVLASVVYAICMIYYYRLFRKSCV